MKYFAFLTSMVPLCAELHLDFHLDHLQIQQEINDRYHKEAEWEREFIESLRDDGNEKENHSSGTVERNRDD